MSERTATCSCGELAILCRGEPTRISVCHCYACQQRSGSAFAVQARFPRAATTVRGGFKSWSRTGDEGGVATFHFCPRCGGTVFYEGSWMPESVAVAVGAFGDRSFPPPQVAVYDERRHPWVRLDVPEVIA